jgi:hypothetical protein
MLGGYGAEGNTGMDTIRLEQYQPDGVTRVMWRCPPPFELYQFECGYEYFGGFGDPGGLPEVFGGGDAMLGPWNPYNQSDNNRGEFIYGSPDGVNDGIILILTSGSELDAYGHG